MAYTETARSPGLLSCEIEMLFVVSLLMKTDTNL